MKPQKVDDKIIEVVAHKGSIHLIQIKAGTLASTQHTQHARRIYTTLTIVSFMQACPSRYRWGRGRR
jgi:hypothetical protein